MFKEKGILVSLYGGSEDNNVRNTRNIETEIKYVHTTYVRIICIRTTYVRTTLTYVLLTHVLLTSRNQQDIIGFQFRCLLLCGCKKI